MGRNYGNNVISGRPEFEAKFLFYRENCPVSINLI